MYRYRTLSRDETLSACLSCDMPLHPSYSLLIPLLDMRAGEEWDQVGDDQVVEVQGRQAGMGMIPPSRPALTLDLLLDLILLPGVFVGNAMMLYRTESS